MDSIIVLATALAPVITGFVEVIKRYIPEHHKDKTPFLAVLLGIGLAYILYLIEIPSLSHILPKELILSGLIAGLSSAGIYDLIPKNDKEDDFDYDDYDNGAGTPE